MRRHTVLSAFILVTLTSAAFAAPVHLRCEYLENPLGIDKASPRLSWQSDNVERDWKQSAYEILVASSVELLHTGKRRHLGQWKKLVLRSRSGLLTAVLHWNLGGDTTGKSGRGTRKGKYPSQWNSLGGRWAFFTPRTGRPTGFAGKTPTMTPIVRQSTGFG